jgi:hypothetical protein
MAIARDTTGTRTNSGATLTPSQTFNNVGGNFIVWGFFYDRNATISAVTWGGTAVTVVQTVDMTGWVYKLSLLYLPSAATGSNTLSITLTGTSAQATIIQGQSYSGAATSPVDSSNSSLVTTTGSITASVSLTPTTSTGWMVGYINTANGGTLTAGTNTSIISGGTTQDCMFDTNGVIGSGAQTLNIVESSASAVGTGMVGLSFKDTTPVASATFAPQLLTTMVG